MSSVLKHLSIAILASVSVATASTTVSAADAANGEKLFKRCATCHTLTPGGRKIGPSLYGVFGRTSGTLDGFRYSNAMQEAAIVWSEETIDAYIANPREYVPGNRMAFPGLRNPEERADVIAYLKTATGAE